MTKKLNPMLKPENRAKLLKNGMENIDRLQKQTIREAREKIKDYDTFQKTIYQQFQASIRIYKKRIVK